MEMILTGIENKNEYYTNHYFTSIFQENAEDTIKNWKEKGLNKLADIIADEEVVTKQKIANAAVKKDNKTSLKHKNYEQRKDINWNDFYDNM